MPNKRTTINITLEAKAELDTIKALGQSYDGLIWELVEFYKEKNKEYWTQRRKQRAKQKGVL